MALILSLWKGLGNGHSIPRGRSQGGVTAVGLSSPGSMWYENHSLFCTLLLVILLPLLFVFLCHSSKLFLSQSVIFTLFYLHFFPHRGEWRERERESGMLFGVSVGAVNWGVLVLNLDIHEIICVVSLFKISNGCI